MGIGIFGKEILFLIKRENPLFLKDLLSIMKERGRKIKAIKLCVDSLKDKGYIECRVIDDKTYFYLIE